MGRFFVSTSTHTQNQQSETMRILIAAMHSRPVQYSQKRTYRQEAPTRLPPTPSSPRGRGLVEPYRPLGPLPPRAVRAVARLGPHPVADGHPIDVAALAAPPHHGARVGAKVLGAQAAAQIGVELPGNVRPLRSEAVAALGEIMPPSPMARRALAALLASPPPAGSRAIRTRTSGIAARSSWPYGRRPPEGFKSPSRSAFTVI